MSFWLDGLIRFWRDREIDMNIQPLKVHCNIQRDEDVDREREKERESVCV